MTDKLEEQLAEGIERAQSLHPLRDYKGVGVSPNSIEAKLVDIERIIRDIRQISTAIKGQLG